MKGCNLHGGAIGMTCLKRIAPVARIGERLKVVSRLANAFTDQNGRAVSSSELATHLGYNVAGIARMVRVSRAADSREAARDLSERKVN